MVKYMELNPLKTKSMKKIVLKNTLKNHYSINALIELIVKQVKDIPDFEKLKQDIELILLVCSMIETISTDSDIKIDKLEAIVGIYKQLFEMTTDDQLMLINIVNFLHQNKSFVYKKGVLFVVGKAVSWLTRQAVSLGINVASNRIV